MEQTIAVITIKITDDMTNPHLSSFSRPENDGINWTVTLRPNADFKLMPKSRTVQNAVQNVMAHELGHVIARITFDPAHDPINVFLAQMSNDGRFMIPAEKKANTLAGIVYPAYNHKLAKQALKTYSRRKA